MCEYVCVCVCVCERERERERERLSVRLCVCVGGGGGECFERDRGEFSVDSGARGECDLAHARACVCMRVCM